MCGEGVGEDEVRVCPAAGGFSVGVAVNDALVADVKRAEPSHLAPFFRQLSVLAVEEGGGGEADLESGKQHLHVGRLYPNYLVGG